MAKQVIVLTPGRSGSSMVAEILMRLGVVMGEKTRPPDAANLRGYFEDNEFTMMNRRLLAYGPETSGPDRLTINPLLWKVMQIMVTSRDIAYPLWGFKDGAQCLTCDLWHPLFSDPHYIYVWRAREEVAQSHVKAWGFDLRAMREHYDILTGSAEAFLETQPHLRVCYDDLLATRSTADIAAFIGVPDRPEVAEVIQPALRTIYV